MTPQDSNIRNDKAEVLQRLELLKTSLPKVVDPAGNPVMPKVAYKYLVYREACLYRFCELCEAACHEASTGRLISALVLTRAAFEVSAALFFIELKMTSFVKSDNPSEVNESATRLLLGARWSDWKHQAINILSMINKMEKYLPGARATYDRLSEFSHPNWQGTLLAFSKANKEMLYTDFGHYPRNSENLESQLWRDLSICLTCVEFIYNRISDIFPDFVECCRRHFERK